MEVPSRHHTKLIGRRGVVINKIRTDNDVQIIFPERVSSRPDVITIVGLEDKTKNARDEILKKVQELVRTGVVLWTLAALCFRLFRLSVPVCMCIFACVHARAEAFCNWLAGDF